MSRLILVTTHTGRLEPLQACRQVCELITEAGAVPVMLTAELADVRARYPDDQLLERVKSLSEINRQDIYAGVVLGGDGTILRAARVLQDLQVPTFGVNMGHVGFLAESNPEDLVSTVQHIVQQNYSVEERMPLQAQVYRQGKLICQEWALNEITVERELSGRMMELAVAVDEQPIMSFGCNGIIVATPTGSTAYAFSAGGPIIWPDVEAILMVPINAHALFGRPVVVSPRSTVTVEMLSRNEGHGALHCDGQVQQTLVPEDRVVFTGAKRPVLLGRIHQVPFGERLVQKFDLPRHGWRGPIENRHDS